MDAHFIPSYREQILLALDVAEDLGFLDPERASATRRLVRESASDVNLATRVLRSSGLLASQLQALTRLGRVAAPPGVPQPDAAARSGGDGIRGRENWSPADTDARHPSAESHAQEAAPVRKWERVPSPFRTNAHVRWIGVAAAVLFVAIYIPLLRSRGRKVEATEAQPATIDHRWRTLDQDLARTKPDAPARRVLLPTDEEVIEKIAKDLHCELPPGAPIGWGLRPAGPLQLTVWSDGKLVVLQGDEATSSGPLQIPGETCRVRKVVRTPWGRGVLLLVEDAGLDFSSRVFLFDPYDRRFEMIFDSDDRHLLQAALRRNGDERLADNDLTDVFFDKDGAILFATEDHDTLRTHLKAGRVFGLDALHDVSPFRDTSVPARSAGDDRAFFTVLYR